MIFRRKHHVKEEPMDQDEFMRHLLIDSAKDRKWRTVMGMIRAIAFLLIALVSFFYAILGNPVFNSSVLTNKDNNGFNVPHTALIKISGVIDSQRQSNADNVFNSLEKAFKNEYAKSIILNINSPGGSPVQAGRIYDDILTLKQKYNKPVYSYIDDVGASAGYYIALAGDKIYANRASLVGSIGVISSSFGIVDAMNTLGIERRTIKSGENKNFLDPFSVLLDEQAAFWENQLSITHQQFIDRVLISREGRLDVSENGLFTGLIWTGEEAKRIGLIDDLSSPNEIANELSGEPRIIEYKEKTSFLEKLSIKRPFNLGFDGSVDMLESVLTEIKNQNLKLQ